MQITNYNYFDVFQDVKLGVAAGKTYMLTEGKKLSGEYSRRFNGHLTQCSRESGIDRDRLKLEILRKCVDEQWQCNGGSPYPYTIIDVKLLQPIGDITHVEVMEPLSTSGRTNKQMMTAYDCLCDFAAKNGIILLEKYNI